MKSTTEILMTEAKKMLSRGGDVEEVLSFLRRSGCSKTESIKLLRELIGVRLGEAKRRVHLSDTWKERRETDDEFHASLEQLFSRSDRQD